VCSVDAFVYETICGEESGFNAVKKEGLWACCGSCLLFGYEYASFGLTVHFTSLLLGSRRFVRPFCLCFSLSRSMLCLMPNFRASVPQTGQLFPLSSFSTYGHMSFGQ
jgi:hypothetical protein